MDTLPHELTTIILSEAESLESRRVCQLWDVIVRGLPFFALKQAASDNNWLEFMDVLEGGTRYPRTSDLNYMIGMGRRDMVQHIFDHHYPVSERRAMSIAYGTGNLGMIHLLCENHVVIPDDVIHQAARTGNIDILSLFRYSWWSRFGNWSIRRMLRIVIDSGNLDPFKWMIAHRQGLYNVGVMAAKRGNKDMLWHAIINSRFTNDIIVVLAQHGHIDLLEWLWISYAFWCVHEHSSAMNHWLMKCDFKYVWRVAIRRTQVRKWAVAKGIAPGAGIMLTAALEGRYYMLKWLHEKYGYPMTYEIVNCLRKRRHPRQDIIVWVARAIQK